MQAAGRMLGVLDAKGLDSNAHRSSDRPPWQTQSRKWSRDWAPALEPPSTSAPCQLDQIFFPAAAAAAE